MLYIDFNKNHSHTNNIINNHGKEAIEKGVLFLPISYEEMESIPPRDKTSYELNQEYENYALLDELNISSIPFAIHKDKKVEKSQSNDYSQNMVYTDLLKYVMHLLIKCDECKNDYHVLYDSKKVNQHDYFYVGSYREALRNPSYVYHISYDVLGQISDKVANENIKQQEFFDKINCVCPNCGNNKQRVLNHSYKHLFLIEDENLIKIKSYAYDYHTVAPSKRVNKYYRGNGTVTMISQAKHDEKLKVIKIPKQIEFFINKKTLNISMSFVKNGKRNILGGNNSILFTSILSTEEVNQFVREQLIKVINERATYQKEFLLDILMDEKKKITIETILTMKFYLDIPFAHEMISPKGTNIADYLKFLKRKENRYFFNKLKRTKSGDEILKLYIPHYTKGIKKAILNYDHQNVYRLTRHRYESFESLNSFISKFENKEMVKKFFTITAFDFHKNPVREKTLIKNNKILSGHILFDFMSEYDIVNSLLKEDSLHYGSLMGLYGDTIRLIEGINKSLEKLTPEYLENIRENSNYKYEKIIEAVNQFHQLKVNKLSNLRKLHDKLSIIDSKISDDFIVYSYSEKESSLEFEKEDYNISLYKDTISLKEDADNLHICSYSYREKIQKKSSLLLSLKEKDKVKMCIEVVQEDSDKFKIIQAKLACNNIVSEKENPITKVLNEWVKNKNLRIETHDLNILSQSVSV